VRAYKIFFFLIIGLLLVAVAAVAALVFVDPSIYRNQMERRASAAFNREFKINGPIRMEKSLSNLECVALWGNGDNGIIEYYKKGVFHEKPDDPGDETLPTYSHFHFLSVAAILRADGSCDSRAVPPETPRYLKSPGDHASFFGQYEPGLSEKPP